MAAHSSKASGAAKHKGSDLYLDYNFSVSMRKTKGASKASAGSGTKQKRKG